VSSRSTTSEGLRKKKLLSPEERAHKIDMQVYSVGFSSMDMVCLMKEIKGVLYLLKQIIVDHTTSYVLSLFISSARYVQVCSVVCSSTDLRIWCV